MDKRSLRTEIQIEGFIALFAGLGAGALAVHFELFEKTYLFTQLHASLGLEALLSYAFTLLLAYSFLAMRSIHLLRRRTRELRQANEIIRKHNEIQNQKEKLAALGHMASGLAHEINNALQPTLGLGELIKEALREQGKVHHSNFMDVMMDSARHAQMIIDNVLAFTQSNRVSLSSCEAAEAIGEALAFCRERLPSAILLKARGLESLHSEDGRPARFLCNQTALAQILLNILKNASDAMEHEGEIEIECALTCPLDGEARRSEGFCVSITDHGCGMDLLTQQRLFDPFFSTKDAGAGSGLGLAVVYGLVRQHRGDIAVSSKAGKSSTFTLTFPLEHDEA